MNPHIQLDKTKAESREARLQLEAAGLAATSRLRKLYAALHETLFQTAPDLSPRESIRLDGLAESLSRLGLIEELDALDELMKRRGTRKKPGVNSKCFVEHIPMHRMKALVARRDYEQATRPMKHRNERSTLFRGAIYQGDLDDAYTMLENAVLSRKSLDAFPDQEAVYCAGRLAIVAHWQDNPTLVESAIQIMRCFLEHKALSTRPLDEDTDWMPTEYGFESYFILTLASAGMPDLAETLWIRLNLEHRYNLERDLLCFHLAMAGDTERALRISAKEPTGKSLSTELLIAICFHAAREGDLEAANRFADEFFDVIKSKPQQDLGKAFVSLNKFIQWMKEAKQLDLARRAVDAYIELADKRLEAPDEQSLRALALTAQPHFVKLKDTMPAEELSEFASRQSQFVFDSLSNGHHEREAITKWKLALARIGEIPTDVEALSFQQQIPIVIALIDAGHREEAQRIYRPIADWAAKPLSASPDIPNHPGKVTRARYAMPHLAPYFGELELAMQCIAKLDASDPRSDYRMRGCVNLDSRLDIRLTRSLAHATDIDTATDWAEALTDKDMQLVACVQLLHTATDHIGLASDYERTPIAVELDRINPRLLVFPGAC